MLLWRTGAVFGSEICGHERGGLGSRMCGNEIGGNALWPWHRSRRLSNHYGLRQVLGGLLATADSRIAGRAGPLSLPAADQHVLSAADDQAGSASNRLSAAQAARSRTFFTP